MTPDRPSNLPASEAYYKAGLEWADLEAAASLLEDTKSAVLAQMMLANGDMPVSKAEMITKASPKWTEYVSKVVKARTAANKAKIAVEYTRMKFYEASSREATERIQARL